MPTEPATADIRPLVILGWDHLRAGRPLAARAAWRRALRDHPDDRAAGEALRLLDNAPELPEAARKERRLRPPREGRLDAWAEALGDDRDPLDDLDEAAARFGVLGAEGDDAALFNRGLALAWLGRNRGAVEALDRSVRLAATADPEAAIEAWTLAEVLRQGGGAEDLADDLSHALIVPRSALPENLHTALPDLIDVPVAVDPTDPASGIRAYEWLDRPMPDASAALDEPDLPTVMASVLVLPDRVRFSSPDPTALDLAIDRLDGVAERGERTATPLPLALQDAGLWTFRLPPALPEDDRRRLARAALERRLEDRWIHWPRHGLGGRSPARAARLVGADPILRAKLEAVVRLREGLAQRHRVAHLYDGYPFDRLRKRLGLPVADARSVDPEDESCFAVEDLRRLDPGTLDTARLVSAFRSADGLRDDDLTDPFARELLERGEPALALNDPRPAVAVLVRRALREDGPTAALAWVGRGLRARPRTSWRLRPLGSGDPGRRR